MCGFLEGTTGGGRVLDGQPVTFRTSFGCREGNGVTGRPLISIVCHHDVHLVVAVRDELREDPGGLRVIVWEGSGLHCSVDPQPTQLAAVSPVVDLKGRHTLSAAAQCHFSSVF